MSDSKNKKKRFSNAFNNKRKGNNAISKGWDYLTGAVADQIDSMSPEARQKKMKEYGKKNKNKKYDPNSSRDCEKCAGKSGGCQC